MRMFSMTAAEHRDAFEREGWLHVPGGLDPAFLAYLRDEVARKQAEERIEGKGIQGEKDQFLLELPEGTHWDELFDLISELCGLDRDGMTLSERHVKAYLGDADPRPTAHKDRFASQISVGLSVEVPEGSYLVLYPDDEREPNPYLSGAHRDSLDPDQRPEVTMPDAREVEVYDQPGDVIVFHGAATWHLRRNAANTVVVYLKLNEFECDPLGEDPTTEQRRAATLDLLEGGDAAVEAATAQLSRRFESISRDYRREGWPELVHANVWDQHPFPISELEVRLLQRLDRRAKVGDLVEAEGPEALPAVLRLARRGAVDLLA